MGKNGPTILFDPNFSVDHEQLLEFIELCRGWAWKLYEIDRRISLKFIMWRYKDSERVEQRAEFMWQSMPFIQIRPHVLRLQSENDDNICTQDLVNNGFDSHNCNWVFKGKMWDDAFLPNLKSVIGTEVDRLRKKLKDLDELITLDPLSSHE